MVQAARGEKSSLRKMADDGLARYRATTEPFAWDRAYITSRQELSTNPTNDEDLAKIIQQFNMEAHLMEQSAIPADLRHVQGTRDIFVDMLKDL